MDRDETSSIGIFNDTVSIGGPNQISAPPRSNVGQNDMELDPPIKIALPDASSSDDTVFFNVNTKTCLPHFKCKEFSVQRTHEEFVWLHNQLEENELYAGVIIPPCPPKPDFDASKAKLQRLVDGDGTLTKEDLQKMKAELEAEYLATFKKTVAMHEVFLQRLASHPILHTDYGFHVFLEYKEDLGVRNKNKREQAVDLFKAVTQTADQNLILTSQRDEDSFFREEKSDLSSYHQAVKEATAASDSSTRQRKMVTDNLFKLSIALNNLLKITGHNTSESKLINQIYEFTEDLQKLEVLVGSDEDLKLSDTLRYYAADSGAAKQLLYRRARSLADYEAANRTLDKVRIKVNSGQVGNISDANQNSDSVTGTSTMPSESSGPSAIAAATLSAAEQVQIGAYERFNDISEQAKKELEDFKVRRIKYFKKNLIDHAEVQANHSKSIIRLLKSTLSAIRFIEYIPATVDSGAIKSESIQTPRLHSEVACAPIDPATNGSQS